jgi:hypothetical protein
MISSEIYRLVDFCFTINHEEEKLTKLIIIKGDSIAQNPGFITDGFYHFHKIKFNENMYCTMKV